MEDKPEEFQGKACHIGDERLAKVTYEYVIQELTNRYIDASLRFFRKNRIQLERGWDVRVTNVIVRNLYDDCRFPEHFKTSKVLFEFRENEVCTTREDISPLFENVLLQHKSTKTPENVKMQQEINNFLGTFNGPDISESKEQNVFKHNIFGWPDGP